MLRKTALTFALACALPALAADDPMLAEARSVASAIPPKLLNVLQEEIANGGSVQAIGVCRDKAPAMAKEASEKSGWAIRRVSLKNRNPKAVPDPWEKSVLEDFDYRAAAGENPATIEKGEAVTIDGKPFYRYMKALPTQQICVQCHGPEANLPTGIKHKLKELYPDDRATGYEPGSIRGAITIKKPL